MPREKLVVGMPFYGVTFKLADLSRVTVGSPANATGLYNGTITYPQVTMLIHRVIILIPSRILDEIHDP